MEPIFLLSTGERRGPATVRGSLAAKATWVLARGRGSKDEEPEPGNLPIPAALNPTRDREVETSGVLKPPQPVGLGFLFFCGLWVFWKT